MFKRRDVAVDEYDKMQQRMLYFEIAGIALLSILSIVPNSRTIESARAILLLGPWLLLSAIPFAMRYSLQKKISWRIVGSNIRIDEPLFLTVFHAVYVLSGWILVGSIGYSVLFHFTGLSGLFVVFQIYLLSDVVPRTLGLFRTSGRSYISFGVEGFEMRGSYGEVSRVLWSQKPRVVGVKRGAFLEVEPTVSGSGLAELWTLPIQYSTIERIVDYYVDHPEERAVLGTEEGIRQIERLCR